MIRVPEIAPPAGAFRVTATTRVLFADTDALGIAYYASALRWFELGRSTLLHAADIRYADFLDEGLLLPVVETWVRHRAAARYDDALTIDAWIHELRSASVLIGYHLTRDGTLLVEGGTRLACMTPDGRPRRLPGVLRRFGRATS